MKWPDGKPYYSLNQYYRELFGEKTYKLALDIGATCPNRDGTLSHRGCIYCSAKGSGDFAAKKKMTMGDQIDDAISLIADKYEGHSYVAYLQSFTNTYGTTDALMQSYNEILADPRIKGLSIATRPDCLEDDLIHALSVLSKEKPVWVELGLQTTDEQCADYINRCYPLATFEDALSRLNRHQIPVIVHLIAGLPYESDEEFIEGVKYLSHLPIAGLKFHLLHILKNTELGVSYDESPFALPSLASYTQLIAESIAWLPANIVIHRLTGDAPREMLLAPKWSLNKRHVLNTIHKIFKDKDLWQGMRQPKHQK